MERPSLKLHFYHNAFDTAVEKNNLYPLPPPLTRYEETAIPIMKKKLLQRKLLADDVRNKLKELTISKLCVRLNTLEVSAAHDLYFWYYVL